MKQIGLYPQWVSKRFALHGLVNVVSITEQDQFVRIFPWRFGRRSLNRVIFNDKQMKIKV